MSRLFRRTWRIAGIAALAAAAASTLAAESPSRVVGGGLFLLSMVSAGDEKPVFGEPLRVAGEGAADPEFSADGPLIFSLEKDGGRGLRRFADGETRFYERPTPAEPARPPAIADGELLAARPFPGNARWTLLIRNPAEYPGETWLYDFDPAKGERRPIIAAAGESRVFAWDGAGRVWMADGTNLVRHCPDCGGGWRRMIDLRRFALGPIEALAIAPGGSALAVVVRAPEGPSTP